MECRFNDTDFGALQNTARHGRILNLSSSDTRPHQAKRIGEFHPGSKVTCAVTSPERGTLETTDGFLRARSSLYR